MSVYVDACSYLTSLHYKHICFQYHCLKKLTYIYTVMYIYISMKMYAHILLNLFINSNYENAIKTLQFIVLISLNYICTGNLRKAL